MQNYAGSWQFWALLAAVFAALTAIFAKVGVENVNSNFATFLRTLVVVAAFIPLLWFSGEFHSLSSLSAKTVVFLVLSGLATGASWLCYFRALQLGKAGQVAPVDKMSVVFVAIIGALFLGERMSALSWSGVAMIAGGAVLVAIG